ncbi:hypothetical protein TUM19329_01480 [Legionella antarctica]|uniref:Uncharacterized protein n=1 Tax=Legionella antarctica TaxID=2708020 RepID=A0A6F8T0T6_9GAMM|nr:hypothetical protein [Legionella antarctica]BCA93787.1 hypothetical protein TUM19329_01480 [Legionella antarctica]
MSFKYGWLMMVLLSIFSRAGISSPVAFKDKLIALNCMLGLLKDKANQLAHTDQFSLIETVMDDQSLHILRENKWVCGKFLNLDSYYHNPSHSLLDSQRLLAKLGLVFAAEIGLE